MKTKLLLTALLLFGLGRIQAQCDTVITIFDGLGNVVQTITDPVTGPSFASPNTCIPPGDYTLTIMTMNCQGEGGCNHTPHFGGNTFHGGFSTGGVLINPQTLQIAFYNTGNSVGTINLGMSGIMGCTFGFKGSISVCPLPPPPCPDDTNPECPCPNPSNPTCPCPNPSNPDCNEPGCDPLPAERCLNYKIMNCCEMECIKFNINCPTECENNCACPECYFVTLLMSDGTVETINVNFAGQEYLMNCYSKRIARVLSVTPYDCSPCPPERGRLEAAKTAQQSEIKEERRVEVSPNPAKTNLNFKGRQLQDYTLSMYDDHGHEVMKGAVISRPVNIEKLKRGIYIYVITDSAGYKQTGKIIKE